VKKLLLLLFTLSSLFSATVINYNIYEKEDEESVDIMLSFDAPYEGKIIQKQNKGNKIFILENTGIEKKTIETIHSEIVQKLQLVPFQNRLFIELSAQKPFQVDASKTIDHYGLRLRVTPLIEESKLSDFVIKSEEKKIETKKEDHISTAYLKVIAILFALVALLYLLKNWIQKQGGSLQGSWLFDKKQTPNQERIKIIHQRALDVKNRVALISYGEKEYLILLGTNNLLLDTFHQDSHPAESEFDEVLSQNQEALKSFIKKKGDKLQEYKEKISKEI
jgi:hypothetical protein